VETIMELLAGVLVAVIVGVVWAWRREQRASAALRRRLAVLAGHVDPLRTPFVLLQQRLPIEVARGGDLREGTFDNLGQCPCQHSVTCATIDFRLNRWPNPVPNPLAGFPWNAPPRSTVTWTCPDGCVRVCTDVWRNWSVVQSVNGGFVLCINTFAQYHCKLPDDPASHEPPRGEELPPKPDEVTP
jgi:hypothetical protein